MHFKTTFRVNIPLTRASKHQEIVALILRDLKVLKPGVALKLSIAELPDTKENVRSALNRATRKAKLSVATSADQDFLYIWNLDLETD